MLLLSLSADDYPVTPGDSYRLTYITASTAISVDTVVESDFTVNLSFLGKIPAQGLAFVDLKKKIEQRILSAYPNGSPSITIISNGLFQVRVEGEVIQADYSNAWGLTRISQVVYNYLTPFSSIRDVEVFSKSGARKQVDLFRAIRFGEKEQDPYVRPGDTVVIYKRDRAVRLSGEIRRPGVYQLLSGEGLKELIEYYGDGFTPLADPSRARLERLIADGDKIAQTAVINLTERLDQNIELRDLDTLSIPMKTDYLPIVLLEGAILPDVVQQAKSTASISDKGTSEPTGYRKFAIPIKEGETLYKVLWERRDQIFPDADLANAYVLRKDDNTVIPVDLETLLYSYSPEKDLTLEPFDQLVIPFRQFFVSVTGGVRNPGQYPYVPNKTLNYYLDMAGGIDQELGKITSARVLDRNGRRLPRESFLDPEAKVHVPYSFSYYFFRYFPIITTSTAAIFTAMYYYNLINQ